MRRRMTLESLNETGASIGMNALSSMVREREDGEWRVQICAGRV
jgi:hypothetical protein